MGNTIITFLKFFHNCFGNIFKSNYGSRSELDQITLTNAQNISIQLMSVKVETEVAKVAEVSKEVVWCRRLVLYTHVH